MDQGRGGDQRIPFGLRIGHVESRAATHDGGVDRQNTSFERLEDLLLQPSAQARALVGVTTLDQKHAPLEFEYGDYGKIKVSRLGGLGPGPHMNVGATAIAKLGPDVGVDQIGQSKSAAPNI